MKYSATTVLAMATAVLGGSSMSAPSNGTVTYTTETVTALTTYCPEATQITQAGVTYTITEPTTLTITDCPCTHIYAVTSTLTAVPTTSVPISQVTYSPCPESATESVIVSVPGKSAPTQVSVSYSQLFTTVPAAGSVSTVPAVNVPGNAAPAVPAGNNAVVAPPAGGNVAVPAKGNSTGYQTAGAVGVEVRSAMVVGVVGLVGGVALLL